MQASQTIRTTRVQPLLLALAILAAALLAFAVGFGIRGLAGQSGAQPVQTHGVSIAKQLVTQDQTDREAGAVPRDRWEAGATPLSASDGHPAVTHRQLP